MHFSRLLEQLCLCSFPSLARTAPLTSPGASSRIRPCLRGKVAPAGGRCRTSRRSTGCSGLGGRVEVRGRGEHAVPYALVLNPWGAGFPGSSQICPKSWGVSKEVVLFSLCFVWSSSLYYQHLAECLAHTGCSINFWWNEMTTLLRLSEENETSSLKMPIISLFLFLHISLHHPSPSLQISSFPRQNHHSLTHLSFIHSFIPVLFHLFNKCAYLPWTRSCVRHWGNSITIPWPLPRRQSHGGRQMSKQVIIIQWGKCHDWSS